MKIDWKQLSEAMILAILLTFILGFTASITNTLIAIPDSPPGKTQYTFASTNNGYYLALPFTEILILGTICLFILTIITYLVIGLTKKKKKQN